MKFFGGVGRVPLNNRLHFCGDAEPNPEPGFLDSDHDPDPELLKDSLFTIAIPTDTQE